MKKLAIFITALSILYPADMLADGLKDNYLKVFDTFNRYRASIYVATVCPVKPFEDAAQETKFKRNFFALKSYYMGKYKKLEPKATKDDMINVFKTMDKKVVDDMSELYQKHGCKDPVIKQVAQWHTEFANKPQLRNATDGSLDPDMEDIFKAPNMSIAPGK